MDSTHSEGQPRAPQALGAGEKLAGPERWVFFGYLVAGGVAFWLFDQLITVLWDQFAEPQPTLITGLAALLGLGTAVVLWKTPRLRQFGDESAEELYKVTWPSKQETWSNTVVVIVTSIIAAVILFAFDQFWGQVTDLIYQ